MTSRDVRIDQLEFRWVPQKGFSAIADSRGGDPDFTKRWSQRLAPLARHPDTPDKTSPGTPETSLVHLRFGDGSAAILWRAWRRDAIELDDSAERHPFVCRAFVGPAAALDIGVAVALCRSGLPAAVVDDIAPGAVHPYMQLRRLGIDDFHKIRQLAGATLGDGFRRDPGLALLIATALREPGLPLSVVLPERETCAPLREAPQVSLMWGLFNVAAPLLEGIRPESRLGTWSFSTYEPPHGDTQTSDLPSVVFRHKHRRDGVHPHIFRDEAQVRPRDEADRRAAGDAFSVFGACLAAAYAELGSELLGTLTGIATGYTSLRDRLDEVKVRLGRHYQQAARGLLAPEPDVEQVPAHFEAQPYPPEGSAPQIQPTNTSAWSPPSWGALHTGAGSPASVPVQQVESPAETTRDDHPATAGSTSDDVVHFYELLSRLRGTDYFDVAIVAIRTLLDPAERLSPGVSRRLRQQFEGDGWYVEELRRTHPDTASAAETLAALLDPLLPYDDDHLGETLDELALWVGPQAPSVLLSAVVVLWDRAPKRVAAVIRLRLVQRVAEALDAVERQPPVEEPPVEEPPAAQIPPRLVEVEQQPPSEPAQAPSLRIRMLDRARGKEIPSTNVIVVTIITIVIVIVVALIWHG